MGDHRKYRVFWMFGGTTDVYMSEDEAREFEFSPTVSLVMEIEGGNHEGQQEEY